MKVILAPTAELAKKVQNVAVSVEAEYGDVTVKGSRYTAAHHGKNADNPCPCVDMEIPALQPGEGDILVSHIDLDTLGGVAMAAAAWEWVCCPYRIFSKQEFWQLAAFVDINGPHKLAQAGASEEDIAALYAYWAWSQANRGPRRESDKVHDVTEEVIEHLTVIGLILQKDLDEQKHAELLAAGETFRQAGEKLNEESFVEAKDGVIVRVGPAFSNHLYTTPQGEVCEAVLAFNTKSGGITLSFAEKDDPRDACKIMQDAFGPEAGGHKGIAGSPRGVRQTLSKLDDAVRALENSGSDSEDLPLPAELFPRKRHVINVRLVALSEPVPGWGHDPQDMANASARAATRAVAEVLEATALAAKRAAEEVVGAYDPIVIGSEVRPFKVKDLNRSETAAMLRHLTKEKVQ